MKLKPILITSGVLLVLGIGCVIAGAGMNGGTIKNIEQEIFEEKTRTFENCYEMTIDDQNTDIGIVLTDGEMRVEYTESEKVRYEITENDGKVRIKKKTDIRLFDYAVVFDRQKLTLYIPEGFDGILDVSTSNASLSVEGISTGKAAFGDPNGNMTLTGCTFGDLGVSGSNGRCEIRACASADTVVDFSNGDIMAEELTSSGRLTVGSSNGTIKLDGVTSKELDAGMTNGQITAGTLSVLGKAEFENSNGRITITSITAGELSADNSNGGIKLDYADCLKIKLSTSNADVSGTLAGTIASYSITSDASNGRNSLPEKLGSGDRKLDVEVSNGNISIDFDGSDFCF